MNSIGYRPTPFAKCMPTAADVNCMGHIVVHGDHVPTRLSGNHSPSEHSRLATLEEVPYFIEQGYNGWQRVTAPFRPVAFDASKRLIASMDRR